jgi:large subunit ribosomal protein L21
MYAVFRDGGHQFKVQEGDRIEVDLRPVKRGEQVVFPEVLLLSGEGGTSVGRPIVEGAEVRGTVEGETKGPKLTMMKFRRRKNSRTRRGHRQHYLAVRITDIVTSGSQAAQE